MSCVVNDSKLNNLIRLDAAQKGRIAIQGGMMRSLYTDVWYIKWILLCMPLWSMIRCIHDDLWLDVCDVMMLIALRSEKEQLEQKESNDDEFGSIENKIDPTVAVDSIDAMKSTDGDGMEEESSVDYAALIKVRLLLSI